MFRVAGVIIISDTIVMTVRHENVHFFNDFKYVTVRSLIDYLLSDLFAKIFIRLSERSLLLDGFLARLLKDASSGDG